MSLVALRLESFAESSIETDPAEPPLPTLPAIAAREQQAIRHVGIEHSWPHARRADDMNADAFDPPLVTQLPKQHGGSDTEDSQFVTEATRPIGAQP